MSDKVWIKLPGGAQGWGCECMARTLPLIEADMKKQGLIKSCLDVFQWGYNPGKVSKSAGTHDLGGVIDVAQYSLAQRKVWAKWGVMMFPRTTAFGWFTGNHGHGVWHGCPHQVPYTDWQVRSGMAGGDGLGSSATLKGRRWRRFEAPVRTWQEAVKLYGSKPQVQASASKSAKPTAPVDSVSLKALREAIRTGKPSTDVRKVQDTLNRVGRTKAAGYPPIPLDGRWTTRTRYAYRKHQEIEGYKGADADGYPGPESLRKLGDWLPSFRAVA